MTILADIWRSLSAGSRVLVCLAFLSSALVALLPPPAHKDRPFWLFSRHHEALYKPLIDEWNASHAGSGLPPVTLTLMTAPALQRRLMSGFLSGTPVADLVEVERTIVPSLFAGPLDSVGFVDLTDRIKAEGIDKMIVPASFSPWTSRGRIFGLPHDVHPVALAYRADIIEAAGIDVTKAQTWDDFFALLAPLMGRRDSNGNAERYILSFAITNGDAIESLLLQAGGRLFDDNEQPVIATALNARVLSKLVAWSDGPGQVTVSAPEFSASGNKLRLDGFVLASLMPDWLTSVWKTDLPGLAGKLKLMPLPAWSAGGRRTTVMGGTMLGLSRTAPFREADWQAATHLYLSPQTARELFRSVGVITPVRSNWNDPVFSEPDPYFSGQAAGRVFIGLCDDVPVRSSSPFTLLARARVADAALALRRHARETGTFDAAALEPEALRLLKEAQTSVVTQMHRNAFLPQVEEVKAP